MDTWKKAIRARWSFGLAALMVAAAVAVLGFAQVSYSFSTGYAATFIFEPVDPAMDIEETAGRIGELSEEYFSCGADGGSASVSIRCQANADKASISVGAASEAEALDLAEWLKERLPELASARLEVTETTQCINVSITDLLRMNISDKERSRILSERLSEKYGVPVDVEIVTNESGGEKSIKVKVRMEADSVSDGVAGITVGAE